MTSRNFEGKLSDPKSGAAFTVRVVTRAAKTEAAGVQENGALKIRLKASPAGSAEANKELIGFLAKKLGVPEGNFEVVAGAGERDKLISVEGVTTRDVETTFAKSKE